MLSIIVTHAMVSRHSQTLLYYHIIVAAAAAAVLWLLFECRTDGDADVAACLALVSWP